MMFCFKSILQIWIILIGFRDTNDFVNLGICKHEFKFTYRGYCRSTLRVINYKLCYKSDDPVHTIRFVVRPCSRMIELHRVNATLVEYN